ncbi:MAG: HIT domain-containing protein [Rickettsiales bacterium]
MAYDTNNIFAKILRGDIPCNKVYEDVFALAFHDIAPSAPVHVLVVPKGQYTSFADFAAKAGAKNVGQFFESVQKVVQQLGLTDFRIITNNGAPAGQSVFHFHVHILAGKEMGALLAD